MLAEVCTKSPKAESAPPRGLSSVAVVAGALMTVNFLLDFRPNLKVKRSTDTELDNWIWVNPSTTDLKSGGYK